MNKIKTDIKQQCNNYFKDASLPVVCVQGLGFVGTAMSVAVANACDSDGKPYFNVIGLDLPNETGLKKIDLINAGEFPLVTNDETLIAAFHRAIDAKNLMATADVNAYKLASVTIVDIHLDVNFDDEEPSVNFEGFKSAITTLGERMPAESLIIVETTVPPGTCEKVLQPVLETALEKRGFSNDSIKLAHSYERVMPGKDYYNSIVNFWRVYAGITEDASNLCEQFLSKIVNTNEYPLTKLHSTTSSETAKVLENSYRATNIAFIDEWGHFAESVGIDLFEVIDAIRMRPTHNNIRQPGFGVGGYCLTKDPLLAAISAKNIYGISTVDFTFSKKSVEINNAMPVYALSKLRQLLGGSLSGKRILLLGISYRQDVGDTRYSPSETFVRLAESEGATLLMHDPLVSHWEELGRDVLVQLPSVQDINAVVLAVQHDSYKQINFEQWLADERPIIFDANNVLSKQQGHLIQSLGCQLASIGRGVVNA